MVKLIFFRYLEFSYKKSCFKTIVFYRENLPVKNHGFKTIVFIGTFEEALQGLVRPVGTL